MLNNPATHRRLCPKGYDYCLSSISNSQAKFYFVMKEHSNSTYHIALKNEGIRHPVRDASLSRKAISASTRHPVGDASLRDALVSPIHSATERNIPAGCDLAMTLNEKRYKFAYFMIIRR